MKKFFILAGTLACTMTVTAQFPTPDKFGCIAETPNMKTDVGTVSFKTAKTWKVGGQEWSDVVMASKCQKETYYGYSSSEYNADCRKNESGYGDLFSWCAVKRFGKQLCPAPWRVPNIEDFSALDEALGGDGYGKEVTDEGDTTYVKEKVGYETITKMKENCLSMTERYVKHWGSSKGGNYVTCAIEWGNWNCSRSELSKFIWSIYNHTSSRVSEMQYWSQTEKNADMAYPLLLGYENEYGKSEYLTGVYIVKGREYRDPQEHKSIGFMLRCVKDK